MASDLAGPTRRADAPGGGPVRTGAAAGLRLAFPCDGPDLAAARACEHTVFARRYGNTAEQLRAEYGPYEGSTGFGAVLAADGTAVGAVRLLRGDRGGRKTLADAGGPPWSLRVDEACAAAGLDVATTWDVATFGVDTARAVGPGGDAAHRSVTLALFAVMFGALRDNAVSSFVAVLDSGARRPIAAVGVVVSDLTGALPAPYLGSAASVPVYAHLADLHARHARDVPHLHQQVFHGAGIPGVDPAACRPGAFRLAPVPAAAVVPDQRGDLARVTSPACP